MRCSGAGQSTSLLLFIVVVLACDSPTGIDAPNVLGEYTATWTVTFDQSVTIECAGDLNITEQSDEMTIEGEPGWRFAGWFWIRESTDCDFRESLTEGTIRSSGWVEFDGFIGEQAVFAALDAVFDCQIHPAPLTGKLSEDLLTGTGSIPVECLSPFVGELPTEVTLSADRN